MTRHGLSHTRAYRAWLNMLYRCQDASRADYARYGGRGIRVCKRWLKFTNFYADMGEAPDGMTLSRIDNDGDYRPSNCEWATRAEQGSNTSRMIPTKVRGKTLSLRAACAALGKNYRAVYSRVYRGTPAQEVLAS